MRSAFIKSVVTLLTGKSIAFAVSFLTIPLVARLFTPDDFGVAALFVSVVMIVTIVAALGYEQAIVLPKADTKAASLVLLASFIATALGVCILLVNVLNVVLFDHDLFGARLGAWAWFVPLGALLWTMTRVMDSWLLRHKDFKMMATAEIAQSVAVPGTRLFFGVVSGSSVWALVCGYLIGLTVRIALQFHAALFSLKQAVARRSQETTLKQAAIEYRDFPAFNAPAGLVRSLAHELPVLLLGYIYVPGIVGFYAMASRLVRTPANLLAMSVRRVLSQKFAELHNQGQPLGRALFKTTLGMASLGAVPTLVLMMTGEPLATFFLGATWQIAGSFVEILAPLLLSIWITVPSAVIMIVLRKQHIWLRVQVSVVILQLVVFLLAHSGGVEAKITLMGYVAVIVITNAGVVAYAGWLVWADRHRSCRA